MSSSQPEIILFAYPFSPYARKMVAYLTFRQIPYTLASQPVTMPRPDLAALGMKYRRIPVLSIGKDIYADTALILDKLERFVPDQQGQPKFSATTPEGKTLQKLLSRYTSSLFSYAGAALPTTMPAFQDPKFLQDRSERAGRNWTAESQAAARPTALVVLRDTFEFLENTVLVDGRDWVLGSDQPSLADVNTAWVLDWLRDMPGAYDEAIFTKDGKYPKTWGYLDRFRATLDKAKEKLESSVQRISGAEAVERVLAADFAESDVVFDETDPTGLRKGDEVEGWPTDSGTNHHDAGELIGLTAFEAVIETSQGTRIHHPRWQFAIKKVAAAGK